jgi:hypothetical protein
MLSAIDRYRWIWYALLMIGGSLLGYYYLANDFRGIFIGFVAALFGIAAQELGRYLGRRFK